MNDDHPKIIDADYRVAGEDRWAPFRRWCVEMWWKMRASVIGEEAASWQWWIQILYVVTIGAILVGGFLFSRWMYAFLWRVIG